MRPRLQTMARADGPAPLQSVDGLSLGMDVVVLCAVDPRRLAATGKGLPDDVHGLRHRPG